jgi:serine O-acetyltransferase
LAVVRADLASMAELKQTPFPSVGSVVDLLLLPGTWAVLLFRLSSLLHASGLRPLSRLVYFANCVLFGADLAPTATVGPGLALPHPVGVAFSPVHIGRNVRLMGGVRLGGGGYDDVTRDGLPTIGDDCYIFDGAKVFGAVTVGDRVVVGTNSVVSRDVPSDVIVLGIPARVVKHRDTAPEAPPSA